MFELLKDFGLKALGIVVPAVVAWFYSPDKIAANVKFRVRGDGDGVSYEGGELPKVRIWLLVSNLSPFNIEIDRLVFQLSFGAVVGEWCHVRRHNLAPSREGEWLLEGILTNHQVKYLERNLASKPETRLTVTAFINSRLHNFESTVNMGTGNVRFLNLTSLGTSSV